MFKEYIYTHTYTHTHISPHLRLIDIRERSRKGEREGEKHQCGRETLISCLSTGGCTHNLGMFLDQELEL